MRDRLAFALLSALIGFSQPGTADAQGIRTFCAAPRPRGKGDPRLSEVVRQVSGQPSHGVPSQRDAACIYPLQVRRHGSAGVLPTMGNEPWQAGPFGSPGAISAVRICRDDGIAIEGGGTCQGRPRRSLDPALLGPGAWRMPKRHRGRCSRRRTPARPVTRCRVPSTRSALGWRR